jgi:hypothetical protein
MYIARRTDGRAGGRTDGNNARTQYASTLPAPGFPLLVHYPAAAVFAARILDQFPPIRPGHWADAAGQDTSSLRAVVVVVVPVLAKELETSERARKPESLIATPRRSFPYDSGTKRIIFSGETNPRERENFLRSSRWGTRARSGQTKWQRPSAEADGWRACPTTRRAAAQLGPRQQEQQQQDQASSEGSASLNSRGGCLSDDSPSPRFV